MREMLRQRTVMDQPKLLKFLGTMMPDRASTNRCAIRGAS